MKVSLTVDVFAINVYIHIGRISDCIQGNDKG